MKIIDAHNHPDSLGHDLTRFLENMDQNGISQTWLLSWETPEHEYSPYYREVTPGALYSKSACSGPIPFERCLSYKERAPERFILDYAPDPRLPDACARMRAAHSIYGAKVCGEVKCRMMYDNFDALRLFRLAGDLQMPVVLHLQYSFQAHDADPWDEWFGGSSDTLERVLQACPETVFLGHAPGFWIHISGDDLWQKSNYPPEDAQVVEGGRIPELLQKYPNLYCDISAGSGCMALQRDPVFAKKFLTEFKDRVLYARDYFDARHQEFLDGLGLPEEILAKIYYQNAERLIK